MLFSPPGCLTLLLAATALLAPPLDPPPVKPPDPAADKKTGPPAQPALTLDALKLPADAVLVICEQAADALNRLPRAVVLTPHKYQELLDEIARLKAAGRPDRPVPPGECHLKGKVEDKAAQLQVQFNFVTEQPNALVALACGQGQPGAVQLDGKTPLFRAEADGFFVQVEKPGPHQVSLDLAVRLLDRGGGRGLELDLPRAAITTLELDLPAGVRDLRAGGKPLAETLLSLKNNHLSSMGGLGPLDKLDLTWVGAGAAAGPNKVLTADGRVQVRLDDQHVSTEAELVLKVQGGQANEWRLLVPLGAEVRVAPGDEGRVLTVEKADQPFASLRTVRLKETGASPLTVLITAQSPLPRPGKLTPVGPFTLLGATRQTGTVQVLSAAPDLRLQFHAHGDLAEEDRRRDQAAAFRYWSVPLPEKPQGLTGPGSLSLLDLEAENVRGLIETRVTHTLRLLRTEAGGRLWRVATTVEATPIRTPVDHLKVQLPPDCSYDEQRGPRPAELVAQTEADPATGLVQFKLGGDLLKPFQVTLEGLYRQPAGEAGELRLLLPRPLDTRDRGGQVTVLVPEDTELLPPKEGNLTLEGVSRETHKQVWRSERIPEQVDLAWRPYRPEVRAECLADLTLTPREGQVRQRIRYLFPWAAPDPMLLRVPPALAGRLRVVEGGTPAPPGRAEGAAGLYPVRPADPAGKEQVLVLEYSFLLHPKGEAVGDGQPFAVPLVVPAQASQGETRVRVWGEPDALPVPVLGPWSEQNLEEVKERSQLPGLVLWAPRVDAPLSLRLGEPAGRPLATVLVERALARAEVLDDGGASYRVSFLLTQLATRNLDVELPAPPAHLGLRVLLDGKLVEPTGVDEGGPRAGDRVVRLRLSPDLVRRPTVLEVSYQLPPGRPGNNPLQTALAPPVLRDGPAHVPTRWLVTLPPGWVGLWPEGGPELERAWRWRGWLLVPRLTASREDLERWFAGPGAETASAGEAPGPTLVCWRDSPAPLTVLHARQQTWLLVCSLALLVLGLGLYYLGRLPDGRGRAAWFWPLAGLGALGLAVSGLLWPGVSAAVLFGCEPGAAVLLLAVLFLWLSHERYRRQVVFLPSFSRTRTGSSLVRAGPAPPPGQPTTVDEVPANGSAPRAAAEDRAPPPDPIP